MAWSQAEVTQDVVSFDIPEQSLASALDSYSARTGIVGLYHGQLALGRKSMAVVGRFTPATALTLLLQNSGLEAEYAAPGAFAVVPAHGGRRSTVTADSVARAAVSQLDLTQRSYSGLLQERINDALCENTLTRPGDYRVAVNFRVGSAGDVTDFSLLGSSGDTRRDHAIQHGLQALHIGRVPPAHMPQPFTMVVLPASSGGTVDCRLNRTARRDG
jgi:hypothetical protein